MFRFACSLLLIVASIVASSPTSSAADPLYGLEPAVARDLYGPGSVAAEEAKPAPSIFAEEARDPFPIRLAASKPAGAYCDPVTGVCYTPASGAADCPTCPSSASQSSGRQRFAFNAEPRGSGPIRGIVAAKPLRSAAGKVLGFRPFKKFRERRQAGGGLFGRLLGRGCG